MTQKPKPDARQPRPETAHEAGFKPVALPALRAAMNAAAAPKPRAKSHRESPWMLHEHALIG